MLGRDVTAAAGRAGHDVVALARAELDVTDPPPSAPPSRARAPDAIVNCAAWTDVDGAEAHEAAATAVNGAAPATWPPRRPRRRSLSTSRPTTSSTGRTEPYVEAAPTGAALAYGRSKLAGELAVAAPRRARDRALVVAVRRRTAELRGHDAAARRRARRAARRRRPGRLPDFTGHLAPALVAIAERRLTGVRHVAGGGSLLLVRPRRRDVRRDRRRACELAAREHRRARPPGAAPRLLRAGSSAPTRPCCRPGARAWAAT